jgi:hypothetical protein
MPRFHAMKSLPVLPIVLALLSSLPAGAGERFDLDGSWASAIENCDKIFVRQGNRTTLSEDSDLYGGGFNIDGNRVTGKMARCTITNRKDAGDAIHMLASCATDIMYSSVQLSVKVRDKNSITRIFPGMDEIQINYQRCPR